MAAWAPAVGHVPQPARELEKAARVDGAVGQCLRNLAACVALLQARNDSMGLSRLVIALGIIGAQAADCAEKIEARHDAAMKRAE
jgi:hypothetical protein